MRPAWRQHRLTVAGPADMLADFAAAARGPGVVPWHIDGAALEEDLFNLAVTRPGRGRGLGVEGLSIEGCRILARQLRARVEAHHARAAALVGHGRGCPLDLHVLLPVPADILAQGAAHPAALAWLAAHWGTRDAPRQVVEHAATPIGAPMGASTARSYGFFTGGDAPHAAVARLAPRWPALRWTLRRQPD